MPSKKTAKKTQKPAKLSAKRLVTELHKLAQQWDEHRRDTIYREDNVEGNSFALCCSITNALIRAVQTIEDAIENDN